LGWVIEGALEMLNKRLGTLHSSVEVVRVTVPGHGARLIQVDNNHGSALKVGLGPWVVLKFILCAVLLAMFFPKL